MMRLHVLGGQELDLPGHANVDALQRHCPPTHHTTPPPAPTPVNRGVLMRETVGALVVCWRPSPTSPSPCRQTPLCEQAAVPGHRDSPAEPGGQEGKWQQPP
jgi:hypothetical protein